MPHWGIAMATGPYINMDGEPTYDIKRRAPRRDAGLKLATQDRERAYLEAVQDPLPRLREPRRLYRRDARALGALARRSRRASPSTPTAS